MAASNSLSLSLRNPWHIALRDWRVRLSGSLLILLVAGVFLGPMVTVDFEVQNLDAQLLGPSWNHWMGTDALGRDVLARVLVGGQLSLWVGFLGTLVSVVIGTVYGGIAGYFSDRLDQWMMRTVDILYSLPYMFLVIILIFMFGKNVYVLFIALGLVQWLTIARIVRGQVLSLRNEEFVLAAKALGVPGWRILLRHILPNILGVVIVYATLTVPSVILQESFLSFLGLNVQNCTWGVLISEGKDYMDMAWWLIAFPGGMLSVGLFALNFLGDAMRDAFDPTTGKSS
jgi:oligopeptide transport system permease protein